MKILSLFLALSITVGTYASNVTPIELITLQTPSEKIATTQGVIAGIATAVGTIYLMEKMGELGCFSGLAIPVSLIGFLNIREEWYKRNYFLQAKNSDHAEVIIGGERWLMNSKTIEKFSAGRIKIPFFNSSNKRVEYYLDPVCDFTHDIYATGSFAYPFCMGAMGCLFTYATLKKWCGA